MTLHRSVYELVVFKKAKKHEKFKYLRLIENTLHTTIP